ncbi:MAG TPA: DUF3073 domain-containing protein [Kineosporiaceae bacterium]|nr:DUF3073 domain-containing protein [Kineosporiaceae bacterium]
MGRGRQKAKQTKVARQLKYFSPDTDYDALQRELASGGHDSYPGVDGSAADDDEDDRDDDRDDDREDDDEYADWSPGRGGR